MACVIVFSGNAESTHKIYAITPRNTSENNALAITYADGEFQSLEPGFSKDNQRGYGDILTAYVEETITSGGLFEIKRHKGNMLV